MTRLAFVGFLGALLIGMRLGRRSKRPFDRETMGDKQKEPLTLPVRLMNPGWPPDDKTHRRIEAVYWITSTLILVGSLVAAGLAAHYARGAYDAALRQANTAELTLKNTQRAFVIVNEMSRQVKEDGSIEIAPIIKNSGLTLAKSVDIVVYTPNIASLFSNEMYGNLDPRVLNRAIAAVGAPFDPEAGFDSNKTIPPSNVVRGISISPNGGQVNQTMFATRVFVGYDLRIFGEGVGRFLFGMVKYKDFLDHAHSSKFCFRLDIKTGALPGQGLCSHWNCTDQDDCQADKERYEADFNSEKEKAANLVKTMDSRMPNDMRPPAATKP